METFIGLIAVIAVFALLSAVAWLWYAHDRRIDHEIARSRLPDPSDTSPVVHVRETVPHGYNRSPRAC
ncbi:hypothetical protein [Wenjunlia tyrosinilytica]|jgi:hypothetical protein|uniref:hypothetical protein n=1 Tax=Wenjunlia tyrosinilytica TaxID=1544741 RepID=UPI00166C6220|nr:hypothetical protein [Wenjunlia tyrosinilytica]